jgi:hypothetical protein
MRLEYQELVDLYEKYVAIKKFARHGGALDRGDADSYYHRGEDPHYFVGETHMSERVEITDKDTEEYKAYMVGYMYNERVVRSFKDWGE